MEHNPPFEATGFPSPAADYRDLKLDLNDKLVGNPTATFYMTAVGDDMREAQIFDGNILIVDRSLHPRPGDIVVAGVDGEHIVRYFFPEKNRIALQPANPERIILYVQDELQIFGVVTVCIHDFRKGDVRHFRL